MNSGQTILFLHGADMTPEAIWIAWPGAQFVARARIAGQPDGTDTWGILISLPDAPDAAGLGDPVTATTDDGQSITAHPATRPTATATADPVAVVVAARYWELSPFYVAWLVARVNALRLGDSRH